MHNLRDVGGYRAGDQTTKWRTLYRSDAFDRLTDRGREQFSELNIARVIDLRDDSERSFAPSALPPETTVIANPIFQGVDATIRNPNATIEEFYLHLVGNHGTNYVSALQHILVEPDAAVLVHCTAGKDRTGTLVALALTSIGVDSDDILHDYAQTELLLSGAWAERHLAMMREHGIAITPTLERLLVSSPTEALSQTLEFIEQRFGSVADYLTAHGFSASELDALATKLLTSSGSSGD